MRRVPSNIVTQRIFVQETLALYEESRWAIYVWWLVQGTAGGAFGAIMLSPQLESSWWLLPSYVAAIFLIKRATMKLAQRLFPGDFWWQVTSIFLTSFLLAASVCLISRLTNRTIIAVPLIIAVSFVIAFTHTAFRVVYVRDQLLWVWSAAPLACVAAVAGWLTLYAGMTTLSPARSAAAVGAIIGLLYALLTTILLTLMWDAGVAQTTIGTAYVDKNGEFEEGLKLHDAAIAANPDAPKLYASRAELHIKRGDINRAKVDADRALALDPKSKHARMANAILMSEDGDLDAAITELDQLVDRRFGFQSGYLYRGRAYAKKGEYDRALDDFEKSLQLSEDSALTLVSRAETYYRMGDYDAAIADCEQTFLEQTMMPIAWFTSNLVRAKSNAAKGEYKLAVSDLRAVMYGTSDPALLKEAAAELAANPFSYR